MCSDFSTTTRRANPTARGSGHFVVSAALHHLDAWVRTGTAPPVAPRPTLDATPAFVRDGAGNDRVFALRLDQIADRGPTPRA